MERALRAKWKLNPKSELMAQSTPQQHVLVEVEFATIAGCARAMCNAAHMNDRIHILVANEVPMYSTALINLVVNKDKSQTHYQ